MDGDRKSKEVPALVVAIGLNGALTVGQIVVGVLSHSLAVAADAAHQFVDVIALTIAYIALRATLRPASRRRTYGLMRSDAVGALTSSLLLLLSVGWIAIEAVRRLFHTETVRPTPMIVIGALGLAINSGSAWLVHRSGTSVDHGHAHDRADRHDDEHARDDHAHGHDDDHEHAHHEPARKLSLSASAARLHLITDALGSLVVLLSGLALTVRSVPILDPIASLLLCALIVPSALRLLRNSGDVLLDSVPNHLDVDAIATTLKSVDGVVNVHHVHVWSLGHQTPALSAHVEVSGEASVHSSQVVIDEVNRVLTDTFDIRHSTLQLECHPCEAPVHQ